MRTKLAISLKNWAMNGIKKKNVGNDHFWLKISILKLYVVNHGCKIAYVLKSTQKMANFSKKRIIRSANAILTLSDKGCKIWRPIFHRKYLEKCVETKTHPFNWKVTFNLSEDGLDLTVR
ncbi:MAG: hypothetical protein BWY26_01420 [Elusimicrobia bacterium ADurb.Bin231]|nr:MAG: hypothetical protein BWY26_01420 [Elusimicrobia bacterium ADurb.Bin231]